MQGVRDDYRRPALLQVPVLTTAADRYVRVLGIKLEPART